MRKMIRITKELIDQGATKGIGWNKKQLEILGVEFPLKKGWKNQIIGNLISQEDAVKFLKLSKTAIERPVIKEGSKRIKLTHELIERGRSKKGSWNRSQLEILGVKPENKDGWKKRVVDLGVEISEEDYQKFLQLRNMKVKKARKELNQETLSFFNDLG
jgi:hypothetical protein